MNIVGHRIDLPSTGELCIPAMANFRDEVATTAQKQAYAECVQRLYRQTNGQSQPFVVSVSQPQFFWSTSCSE